MRYKNFKESYKHRAAKKVLAYWLNMDHEAKLEQFFGFDTFIFSPDVAVFDDGHLRAFYEVCHKHPLDGHKLGKMQHFCYVKGIDVLCYEVEADWILNQTDKPESIKKFTYNLTL